MKTLRVSLSVFCIVLMPTTMKAQTGTWNTAAPMLTARAGAAAAFASPDLTGPANTIYVAGGWDNSGFGVGKLETYSPSTNTWATKSSMTVPRYNVAGDAIDGVFYAVGGQSFDDIGWNEAYNPATDTWTTKANMPTGRHGLSVTAVNGKLYAIGGTPNHQLAGGETQIFYRVVQSYDPLTNKWTTKAAMPTGRELVRAAAMDGIIYVMGGRNATSTLSTVEAYDPATNTWSTKASMSKPRSAMYVGVLNGRIFVAGGPDASAESYDPTTDTWSPEPPMSTANVWGVGVVGNGVLYAIGGAAVSGFLDPNSRVLSYTPVGTAVEPRSSAVPSEFALDQNYPNPFNPSTTINFQIPVTGPVSLRIYDAMGREAAVLVNEQKSAGSYTATFDASDLSSGLYLARLQSGSDVRLTKMLLVK